ncbi:MAG: UDP-N-acetylmuramoyl-tripeptide--D-alanyl-D-alanine ligase [Elusimicrobiaceae bacterium]
MKLGITWEQTAKACGGTLVHGRGSDIFDSFETDSRLVKPGVIFWGLKGKVHGANEFLAEVTAKGAEGIIAETGAAEKLAAKPPHIIEAADTLKALQKLAAWHRNRWQIPVAAVTGSNGKSTTKEMLRSIFSVRAKTCANKGNFNNQYGTPLSLLELGPDDRYAVFELGASQKGDIEEIGVLVRPDVGVITNVSPAHLEFFGDIETIYKTKTEIAKCIKPGGALVYNLDNEYLRRLKTEYKDTTVTFGRGNESAVSPVEKPGYFGIKGPFGEFEVERAMTPHNRLNACGAAAAAWFLGFKPEEIKRGLENFTPMPMRLQAEEKKGVHFILDAYNANPASVRAAIDTLLESGQAKPLVAVLGDMKELGKFSEPLHRELGAWLAAKRLDAVFLAGPEIEPAYEPLKNSGVKTEYRAAYGEFMDELRKTLSGGGTCLIKASRAMNFENVFKEF